MAPLAQEGAVGKRPAPQLKGCSGKRERCPLPCIQHHLPPTFLGAQRRPWAASAAGHSTGSGLEQPSPTVSWDSTGGCQTQPWNPAKTHCPTQCAEHQPSWGAQSHVWPSGPREPPVTMFGSLGDRGWRGFFLPETLFTLPPIPLRRPPRHFRGLSVPVNLLVSPLSLSAREMPIPLMRG